MFDLGANFFYPIAMDKQAKVSKVLELYEKLTYGIENDEHSEEKLLRKELKSLSLLEGINLSLTACHVIACIGDMNGEKVNGTYIAKELNITKGGVSKAVAKLVSKNMVEAIRSDSNRKEVYYELTDLGRNVYRAHAQMHEKAKDQQRAVLASYSEGELEIISRFLKDIIP